MLKQPEMQLVWPTSKTLKEELTDLLTKEDSLLMKRKLLEKEKQAQENGSEKLMITLAKSMRKAKLKPLTTENFNIKSNDSLLFK